ADAVLVHWRHWPADDGRDVRAVCDCGGDYWRRELQRWRGVGAGNAHWRADDHDFVHGRPADGLAEVGSGNGDRGDYYLRGGGGPVPTSASHGVIRRYALRRAPGKAAGGGDAAITRSRGRLRYKGGLHFRRDFANRPWKIQPNYESTDCTLWINCGFELRHGWRTAG